MLPSLQVHKEIRKYVEQRVVWMYVQYCPYLAFFRYGVNREYGLKIVIVRSILEGLLKLQQRGILKKHHCQSAHVTVMKCMIYLSLLTGILNLFDSARNLSF